MDKISKESNLEVVIDNAWNFNYRYGTKRIEILIETRNGRVIT